MDIRFLATISGKLRMNFIRIFSGDKKLPIEMSPYDDKKEESSGETNKIFMKRSYSKK